MRTYRHSARATRPSLTTVAAVAMLAALVGIPHSAARPDGNGATQTEVPTANPADNDVDVEETVAEVQRRLREDPALPRLTEEQIRGLVREVAANQTATAAPPTTSTAAAAATNSSERGDRSLMLVMSHSAANMSGERLQSLFTQPPVTRVVPDELLHHQPPHDHQDHHHHHHHHHHQPTAPARPAEAPPTTTAARTPPPTQVPANHRPSYEEPPRWRQPATQQTERPLIFNFFDDEDFLGSTSLPLVSTTDHQTPVTTNVQTTQYPEVTEDSATHSHTAEYATDDIQRLVTSKPPSKPSRVSGYKNQHRHSPSRGPVRRKKPVQPSGAQLGFGGVTDQTIVDQTPSESAFSYSETSTVSPTTTDSWKEGVKGAGNIREDVTTQTGTPTDPEIFEITVGSYDTKPRITFQKGNLDAESQAADIIYNEDWRPPLAVRPDSEASVTEGHSGHVGHSQTTTARATQRPLQHVDSQPFYTRRKPPYITSESILGPGDHPEGSSASVTNSAEVPHHGGGDARPPYRRPHTPPPQVNGPESSREPPVSALVDSGSRPVALETGNRPHRPDSPLDISAASTPPPGVFQRRPGASSGKRRRPIHRKRPVPHDSASVVSTVEATYVRDGVDQPAGLKPFRPLDPGVLDSLGAAAAPAPPTAPPPATTTTAAPAESPDVSAAAAALAPAVRELLQSLGLLDPPPPPPPAAAPAAAGPPPPDPAPFRAFKPLPLARAEPHEQDMRQLLHRFGLLDPEPPARGRRRQKTLSEAPPSVANETTGDGSTSSGSTTTSTTPLTLDSIDTSMLTDEMRAVLQNLGIVPDEPTTRANGPGQQTTAGGTSDGEADESTARQGPEHVFSPTSLKHSQEESARLQAVLDSVRQFAATHLNATPPTQPTAAAATARADRTTTTGPSPLAAGPDPLSFDELLAEIHSEESRRNEVKRQQPADANATATTTGAPQREVEEVTSPTNRTAEDEARVQALSESFGGDDYDEQEGGGEQAVQRPNGLYFLVDWNSFLRVGEEDNPRINLRFSPRAGNPRNFLPITVP